MDGFPNLDAAKAGIRTGAPSRGNTPPPLPPRFHVINPVTLVDKLLPPREWIVEDWLPIGCVTANYGDGGTGKTLLSQQLMTATASGKPWCGFEVMQCRSVGYFCEDDEGELHRRQAAICAAYGVGIGDLEAMRWISGVGEDNSLLTFDFEGAWPSPLYELLKAEAIRHGARLVVLDTAADLFSGNENDRHQVRRFIGQLNRLAIEINGAVLLNAHPSRTGLASGNLDGGSTAWNNSVRSRWSLARAEAEDDGAADVNARVLTRRKANYAAIGDTIRLQWRSGVLVPQHVAVAAPGAAAAAEALFLTLLDRCMEQGRHVSHSSNATNFAPKVFGKHPDRAGYGRKDFEIAMGTLFAQQRIRVVEYGRSSDLRQRIERDDRKAGQ